MAAISLATLALLGLALIKVGTAFLVVATGHVPVDYQFLPTTPPSMAVRLLTVGVFAGAGVLLSGFGRRDRRAVRLGIVFLLVATTFSNQILTAAARSGGTGLDVLAGLMAGLNVDALYAWMFWLFVSEFPRASATRTVSSLTRLGAAVAFAVGSTLFVANVLLTLDAMSLVTIGDPFVRTEVARVRTGRGCRPRASRPSFIDLLPAAHLAWAARPSHRARKDSGCRPGGAASCSVVLHLLMGCRTRHRR